MQGCSGEHLHSVWFWFQEGRIWPILLWGWGSVRWLESWRRGSKRVSILVFPRLLSPRSHGTTLLTPFSPCPLLSSSQTASWRRYRVSSPAEGLLQSISAMKRWLFLPVFHPTLFSGERLREEGNYYMWGERGPGDATASPARPVGGGRGSRSETGRGETWDLWKRLGMTQEKLPRPLHHPRPVLSCPKVFPIMFSVCRKVQLPRRRGSLKASRLRQACVKACTKTTLRNRLYHI